MTLRRMGRWAVVGLAAISLFFTVVWAGQIVLTERGLAELSLWTVVIDVAALIAATAGLVCIDRTFSAQGWRLKLLWSGRALGLMGAALAISFPATLFNEVVFSIGRGRRPGSWFPNAVDHSAATIPLDVLPAVVALRWPRLGAALFVVSGLYAAYEKVYQPFGVIFPEATRSGFIGIPVLDALIQPAFIVAVLLLVGSARGGGARRTSPSSLIVAPR